MFTLQRDRTAGPTNGRQSLSEMNRLPFEKVQMFRICLHAIYQPGPPVTFPTISISGAGAALGLCGRVDGV